MDLAETVSYALLGLVALGAVLFPVASIVLGARWQRRALARRYPPGFAPAATVIVPVRGHHQGLDENLGAIASQRYPDFEVLLVVDRDDDPAADVVRGLNLPHTRLLSVERHGHGLGAFRIGKCRAQACGVRHARRESRVLAFADADARPGPDWLQEMILPLQDARVGAVTAYRWYVSERRGFWSRVRSQWNGTGLDAMLMDKYRFCWGGSMAIRRKTFQEGDVLEAWRTSITDDVALTRAVQTMGRVVAFAPRACSVNVEECTRAQCVEWCVRQTALTRESMPKLWRFAARIYAASAALFLAGVGLVALAVVWHRPPLELAGYALLAPMLTTPIRTRLRWRFMRGAIPSHRDAIRREGDSPLLGLLMPWFMLYVIARSARVGTIEWRGRRYEVRGR